MLRHGAATGAMSVADVATMLENRSLGEPSSESDAGGVDDADAMPAALVVEPSGLSALDELCNSEAETEGESEADILDVLAHTRRAPCGGDVEVAALPVPVAQVAPQVEVGGAAPWSKGELPKPSDRSAFQHLAVTKVMREAKARRGLEHSLATCPQVDDADGADAGLTLPRRCELVCSTTACLESIANQFGISRTHVRNVFASCALAGLVSQTDWMAKVLWDLMAQGGALTMWERLKADETQQVLTMEISEEASEAPSTGRAHALSWAVLVQHRIVGWQCRDGSVHNHALQMLPTVMIASKNSGCYHDALVTQLSVRRAVSFIRALRNMSDWRMSLRESDDDKTIKKVWHVEAGELVEDNHAFVEDISCGLHQQNILSGGIVKLHSDEEVAASWHYARLQREGNYFLRQVLAVAITVDLARILRRPPQEDNLYWRQIIVTYFWPRPELPRRRRDHDPEKYAEAARKHRSPLQQ